MSDEERGAGGPLASDVVADETVSMLGQSMTSATVESGDVPADERALPEMAFGRYRLAERIGAGGMGVVYRAFDPMLERPVALKIVRSLRGSTEGQRRLFREAQVLAQVRHPNVVSVHDVGALGEDVFVAMEMVEGAPMSKWQKDREMDEVLSAYLQAGRGLAAAHERGLVHRDVKPGNILVGDDGRVTVIDFGLAAVDGERPVDRPASVEDSLEPIADGTVDELTPSSLSAPLTRAGSIMGTPRYMSPEQHDAGARVDALSDQYSFALALYEALTKTWPFTVKRKGRQRIDALRNAKQREEYVTPERALPAHLRRTLQRALSADPHNRFPSMPALLEELGKDPARARRRALVLVAAAAGIAGIAFALARGAGPGDTLCKGAAGEFDAIWADGRREAMRASFLARNTPYAADTAQRVNAVLDRYRQRWVAMHTEACEATHLRGTQSDRMLDARMSCLGRRRSAASALISVFVESTDARTVENAVSASLALPSLDACADEVALNSTVPPPDNPTTRSKVDELRKHLNRALALKSAARDRDGLAVLDDIESEVQKLGYEPLIAEAQYLRASLHLGAGDYSEGTALAKQALKHAARSHDDSLVSRSWTLLLEGIGSQGEYAKAFELIPYAEAALARIDDRPEERALFLGYTARLHLRAGDYKQAISLSEAEIALLESSLGKDHPRLGGALSILAGAHHKLGHDELAIQYYEKALRIREATLGPDHPEVGRFVYNIGVARYEVADYETSEKMHERALDIFGKTYGDDHPYTAQAYAGLGGLYFLLDRLPEAEAPARRSLEVRRKLLGDEHPRTASSMVILGAVLSAGERFEEAETHLEQGLAIREQKLGESHAHTAEALAEVANNLARQGRFSAAETGFVRALELQREAFGDEHPDVARTRLYYADALARAARCPEARALYERVLSFYRGRHDQEHPDLSWPLAGLGACELSSGKHERARDLLEQAVSLREAHTGVQQYRTAQVWLQLATALWFNESERDRARSFATRARAVFAADRRPSAAQRLAQVDRWFAQRNVAAPR